jgi:hypothetical protein
VGVEQREDVIADAGKLGLDLGAVFADGGGVGLVAATLLLLFDRRDDPPRRPARANDFLLGDGELQVALLDEGLLRASDAVPQPAQPPRTAWPSAPPRLPRCGESEVGERIWQGE